MRFSDRYAIEEQLAVGGMGTVYRALDERLHRRVAIKVLKDHLSHDDRFVERFRREARAVASLTHPNIASLYDYGEDEGRHYIVMELVEGRDLAELLRNEGALPPGRAEEIARQMCSALAVAHGAGVVHRDVKPANVLLSREGVAKVTDFGIARAAGDSSLTATGSILGTAHYLAPEQAAGDPATPQTDVYATGIVLFEMLTGRVPFEADSPVAVATRHMQDDVPSPGTLVADIPPHLDDVVRTATAKDPDRRYPDAGVMGAALQGVIAAPGAAVTSEMHPRSTETMPLPRPSRPSWDTRRIAIGALGGLLLLLLALLAFRLVEDRDRGGDRNEQRPAAAQEDPAPALSEQVVAIPDVTGVGIEEAAAVIAEEGLRSLPVGEESGVVIATEPEVGSKVLPGTTVTLLTGPAEDPEDVDEDDLEDDDDEEGSGPPPHSEGKTKGKEKKDK